MQLGTNIYSENIIMNILAPIKNIKDIKLLKCVLRFW